MANLDVPLRGNPFAPLGGVHPYGVPPHPSGQQRGGTEPHWGAEGRLTGVVPWPPGVGVACGLDWAVPSCRGWQIEVLGSSLGADLASLETYLGDLDSSLQ